MDDLYDIGDSKKPNWKDVEEFKLPVASGHVGEEFWISCGSDGKESMLSQYGSQWNTKIVYQSRHRRLPKDIKFDAYEGAEYELETLQLL